MGKIANISFEEHLDRLAASYGENYSLVPTSDEIFQGSYKIEVPLSVTQSLVTAEAALGKLQEAWERFRSKPNVIIDQYLTNFIRWLSAQPVEVLMVYDARIQAMGFCFRSKDSEQQARALIQSKIGG